MTPWGMTVLVGCLESAELHPLVPGIGQFVVSVEVA